MKNIRKKAMTWWNTADNKNKEVLCRVYYRGRNHSSLTGREIEQIWIKECPDSKICDTFKINEKVSYKKESESEFHLTVLNNKGVYNGSFGKNNIGAINSPVYVGSYECRNMCGHAKEENLDEYWIKCTYSRKFKINKLLGNE